MGLFVTSEGSEQFSFPIYSNKYWLLKTVKFNSGGRDKCTAGQEHLTMLLRARAYDYATSSKSL